MKHVFHKVLSLLLLGVFLFAYTEKNVHDIVHADDPHCNVLYEHHFHTQEHHCAICDFEFPWYHKSVKPLTVSAYLNYSEVSFITPVAAVSLKEASLRPSRAPPQVA